MTKRILATELHRARWSKSPSYRKAYAALEDEYRLASAIIAARKKAKLTQEQLAKLMHTTQTAVARLESGRVMPSTRTLKRIADATGLKVQISFR